MSSELTGKIGSAAASTTDLPNVVVVLSRWTGDRQCEFAYYLNI